MTVDVKDSLISFSDNIYQHNKFGILYCVYSAFQNIISECIRGIFIKE
jgi:hypothetical protein